MRTRTAGRMLWALAGIGATAVAAAWMRRRSRSELRVAEDIDLDRYMGTWYEIARLPTRFERDCHQGVATYRRDGDVIQVVNQCATADGHRRIEGTARVADPTSPARLKVRFWGPFWGDYQILWVDDRYHLAVVGEPRRRYAWILARTPTVEEAEFERLCGVLRDQGFDTSRLIRLRPEHPEEQRPAADLVDEAGLESFPASDPPAFTPETP